MSEQERKFTLLGYMCDIASNWFAKNNLEHLSIDEALYFETYKTEEQREWLEKFQLIYWKVEERDCEIRDRARQLKDRQTLSKVADLLATAND